MEVAQVARRLAEYVVADYPSEADALGGIDPDVVEAAALAHDLGHPPFGHVAEILLDQLIRRERNNSDGFEGNPQSFRVVTKLALRHPDFSGLNLTRATLNAVLKYPWTRAADGGLHERKWGAYSTERAEFDWARRLGDGETKSVEAALMDWADDISYSVHDLDDFYRVGLIPLDRILTDAGERERFLDRVFSRWGSEGQYSGSDSSSDLIDVFDVMTERISYAHALLHETYAGTRQQRADLRSMTASLINRYVNRAVTLNKPSQTNVSPITIVPEFAMEVTILKELNREYVLNNPALATQEYGQRRLIRELFDILANAASDSDFSVFPPPFSERLEDAPELSDRRITRIVADFISGMTERQTVELHQRLTGASLGSILDAPAP